MIGITILKASTDTSVERYLNIYTEGAIDGEGDEGSSIEAIAQNCLMVELAYTPYHLYHTVLPQQNVPNEVIFYISNDLLIILKQMEFKQMIFYEFIAEL